MNKTVNNYLVAGCGRCPLGGTPACKVHKWTAELEALRTLILDCGLTETSKWGVPCYTFQKKNVLLIGALKESCTISFFKGALLKDPEGILEKPGAHTQASRVIRFTGVARIQEIEVSLKAYIFEALEIEKAGLKVALEESPGPVPEELESKFKEDPVLKSAFEALTPGRKRGYMLHFSQPKQAGTRVARIEKCIPKILNGEGLHDKYKSMRK